MVAAAKAAMPTVGDQAAALQLGNFAKATASALAELKAASTKVSLSLSLFLCSSQLTYSLTPLPLRLLMLVAPLKSTVPLTQFVPCPMSWPRTSERLTRALSSPFLGNRWKAVLLILVQLLR